MKQRSKDNKILLFLQIWFILLIVTAHSFVEPEKNAVKDFIYSFTVQLFLSVSGFLFMLKLDKYSRNVRAFLINKVKRLLIPYVFISLLAYMVKISLNSYALRPVEASFVHFLHGLVYPWKNANIYLWFLPTLFIYFTGFSLLSLIYKFGNTWINLSLFILLAVLCKVSPNTHIAPATFLNYSGCAFFAVFFFVGMMLCRYKHVLYPILKNNMITVIVLLISLACFVLLTYSQINMYLVKAMLGVCFSWALAVLMRKVSFSAIEIIGRYSYQILLLSWFINQAVIVAGWKILHWNAWICYVLGFASAVIIPVLIVKCAQKYIKNETALMLIGL